MENQEDVEYEDANTNYREAPDDQVENNPQDLLAAAGLEDSDAEDDAVISLSPSPPSTPTPLPGPHVS